MDDAKIRVENELNDLTTKIVNLVKFQYTEKFSELSNDMQYLMCDQLRHMMEYASILRRRLHIWGKTNEELSPSKSCCM